MISEPGIPDDEGHDDFLATLAGVHWWKGEEEPDMVVIVKLNQAITVLPGHKTIQVSDIAEALKQHGNLDLDPYILCVWPLEEQKVKTHLEIDLLKRLWGERLLP